MPWHVVAVTLVVLIVVGRCAHSRRQHSIAEQVWEHPESSSLPRRYTIDAGFTLALAFSPDGELLASGGNTVRLWNTVDGREHVTLARSRGGGSVAFSPDGATLAASVASIGINGVGLWSVRDGSQIRLLQDAGFQTGVGIEVPNVAFSSDGALVAGAADDHVVRLWEVQSGRLLHRLQIAPLPHPLPGPGDCVDKPCVVEPDTDAIRALAFSPVDRTLAVCLWNGTVQLWDTGSAALIRTIGAEATSNVAFSPDGQLLALGQDNDIHIRRVHDGQVVQTIPVHRGESWRTNLVVWQVAFSGDGTHIAAGSNYFYTHPTLIDQLRDAGPPPLAASASTIHVYRMADQQLVGMIPRYQAPIRSVAFSADNATVAATQGHGIHVWEVGGQ